MYLDIIKIVTNLHGNIVQYTKYHKLQDKTKTIKKTLDLLKKIVLKVICERSQNISSSDTVRVNVLIIGRRCVKANTTNALF